MFELPVDPMFFANHSPGITAAEQLYAEVANAADMDLGYEVAFPFLTDAEDGSTAAPEVRP